MKSFYDELKRRNVIRVGAGYAFVAWLLIQVADVLLPIFEMPSWLLRTLTIVLIAGFPLALIFAWLFELTSEGVRPDSGKQEIDPGSRIRRRKVDFGLFILMAIAILLLATDRFTILEPESTPTGKSIAVLPFENRSAVAEDAYFVDGIHDDILTQLAGLSAFSKVISRTSVAQYRDTQKTMPEIGRELGVNTLLEGGVQRAGDRIRINVQLIDAVTDEHLWAQTWRPG